MKSNHISLSEWLKRAIWILFAAIIGYLLIASIFSTCYVGEVEYLTDLAVGTLETNVEHTFYIRDTYILHILLFIVFSYMLTFKRKKESVHLASNKWLEPCLCIFAGVVAAFIVFKGQLYPKYDQRSIIETAVALKKSDFSAFHSGEYLFKYPYQIGIVLFYEILITIFGEGNYVAFEIVNAALIALTYYLLSKISNLLWKEHTGVKGKATAIVCLLFLPYLFYATFLYRTVVGLAFAVFSFYLLLLFQQRQNYLHLLLSSISMSVAIVLKSNYLIFWIAAVVYLILNCIKNKKNNKKGLYSNILFVAVLAACYWLGTLGTNAYIKKVNEGIIPEGVPMSAFVVIGLSDSKGAPGWHNNYDETVWVKNEYNYEAASAEAQKEIKNIISKYPKNITGTISFFSKKIASQWNNPTFQSLWIQEGRMGKDGLEWILKGKGRALYIFFTNLLQTCVLAGVFIYTLFRFKKSSLNEVLLPVTFIGGFLFHIFWEAKSIYVMPFFLLLMPLCVCGFAEWRKQLLCIKTDIIVNGWGVNRKNRVLKTVILSIAGIGLICALSYTDAFAKVFARNDDTGVFDTYTQEIVNMDAAVMESGGGECVY